MKAENERRLAEEMENMRDAFNKQKIAKEEELQKKEQDE